MLLLCSKKGDCLVDWFKQYLEYLIFCKYSKHIKIAFVLIIVFLLLFLLLDKGVFASTTSSNGYGMWTFNDGSNNISIDMSQLDLLAYTFIYNTAYNPHTFIIVTSSFPCRYVKTSAGQIWIDFNSGYYPTEPYKMIRYERNSAGLITKTSEYTDPSKKNINSTPYKVFASNYDILEWQDPSKVYFEANFTPVSPYLANTLEELRNFNMQYLNVMTREVSSPHLILTNVTTGTQLFNIDLTSDTYEQYYQRLDLENPFSELGYIIPVSSLPEFELAYTNSYKFTITYDYAGYSSAIDFDFQSLITKKLGNGVDNSGKPTPTPPISPSPTSSGVSKDDLNELGNQITGSIEESTDKILDDTVDENNMNIDTSAVDSVDDTNVFDLLYKMSDIFTKAFTYDNNEVSTIDIPIRDNSSITLSSDLISKYLPASSLISTLLGGLWLFIFGKYLWSNAFNIIESVKSGDVLDGQISVDEVISDKLL